MNKARLSGAVVFAGGLALGVAGVAMMRAAALLDGPEQPTADDIAVLREAAAFWRDIPGLAATAREALVQRMLVSAETSDPEAEAAIAELLAVRPLASSYWAALAWYRGQIDPRSTDFENALAMSYLVEGREPQVQIQRVELGMALWDALSEENRKRITDDVDRLVADGGLWRFGGVPALRAVLAAGKPETLGELRRRLAGRPGSAALPREQG